MRSPAFSFYATDWLAPGDVRRMSAEERGVYIDLLAYSWDKEGIPVEDIDDPQMLARMSGVSVRKFRLIWAKVSRKFERISGEFSEIFVNSRLEHERSKQKKYAERQTQNARKRWDTECDGNAGEVIPRECFPSPSPSPSPSPKDPPKPPQVETSLTLVPPQPSKPDPAEVAIGLLNELTGSKFRAVGANRKACEARIASSSLEDVLLVIRHMCKEWLGSEKMKGFLRPDTLFRESKFESYLGQAKAGPSKSNGNGLGTSKLWKPKVVDGAMQTPEDYRGVADDFERQAETAPDGLKGELIARARRFRDHAAQLEKPNGA